MEIAEETLGANIASSLKRAFSDPNSLAEHAARQVLQGSRSIGHDVDRAGLREDRTDADTPAAISAGAPAIGELIRVLDRLGLAPSRRHLMSVHGLSAWVTVPVNGWNPAWSTTSC
jgi:hypothetical protein